METLNLMVGIIMGLAGLIVNLALLAYFYGRLNEKVSKIPKMSDQLNSLVTKSAVMESRQESFEEWRKTVSMVYVRGHEHDGDD